MVKVTLEPTVTVCDDGCVVKEGTTGAGLTVSVTAEEETPEEAAELVAFTVYKPASLDCTLVSESVAPIWPGSATLSLYHWKVGVGKPVAAAVNVTLAPTVTVWEEGCVVNAGTVFTVSVAALEETPEGAAEFVAITV